jgi:hypothetical protein
MTYAMSVNIRDKIGKLSAAQRKKVKDRAAEIIAEEMSLHDPRKASKLTRAQRLVRKHVKSGTSLVDELIAERCKAPGNQ